MELPGRVALITGGRRIGAVVATELARGGADVALVYRHSRGEAEETADAARAFGRRALVLQADLRQPDTCERLVDETVDALGRLDILVNMASLYASKPFDDVTVDDWDAQLEVDLRAAWLCARAAVPHMRRLRGGRIINFADWVARSGRPALSGLSDVLRREGRRDRADRGAGAGAGRQTRFSSTPSRPARSSRPKASRTRSTPASSAPRRSAAGAARSKSRRPCSRSIDSDFITGETIRVDGGRHLK